MVITKHLLEQFISLQGIELSRILTELNKIGLEVEAVRTYRLPDSVVVGKVLELERHPSADKLKVCKVDVGEKVLQIVCGASNVAKDAWVAVALEGSRLPTAKGEQEIRRTSLRGVESLGMLCSSTELGLPAIGEGIMLLDESIGELVAGKAMSDYPLFDNFAIHLGITPNRGDCLSVLGVARDLSVALSLPLRIRNYKDENTILGIGRVLQVSYEGDFSSCVLYKVAQIHQIRISLELKLSLALCEIVPVGGIQDYINYAMHNVGVILRAYPFERFRISEEKAEIRLKKYEGCDAVCVSKDVLGHESLIGISPSQNDIQEGMVILEASYIPPLFVSECIYEHKSLPKDPKITYKSTRGSNPDVLLGMQYFCEKLILGSEIEVYSSHHKSTLEERNIAIKTTFESIAAILGQSMDKEEVTNILKKIGFRIEASCDESFFMAIPPIYRHDIHSIQDVVEEILRFYGIEKIAAVPLLSKEQGFSPRFQAYRRKRDLIKRATSQGFNESLHYVFYERSKMEELGLECLQDSLDLINPITQELNTLRSSLLPAMLDSIRRNENLGFEAIGFCEIGICFDERRREVEKIAFLTNALRESESFSCPKGVQWDFYAFASSLGKIIGSFELEEALPPSLIYHPFVCAKICVGGEEIGHIGKVHPRYGGGFLAELLLSPLLQEGVQSRREFSRFQASKRDLTVMVEKSVAFSKIKDCIEAEIRTGKIQNLQSFYPLDIYEHPSFGSQVALSLRFVLQSMEGTLQDETLNATMERILELLSQEFGASLRQ